MFIIVSGPSGSGKNTIINAILEKVYNMEPLKSCTTRKPRPGCENDYFYISLEEFEKKKANGEFFETEMVHQGIWYGVLNSSIEDVIKGDKHYVKDVDVNGAEKISSFLLGKATVLKIFIDAPNEVLKERLLKRGESEDKADLRISRAEYERTFKKDYDLCVENIELDATKRLVLKYIEQRKNAMI